MLLFPLDWAERSARGARFSAPCTSHCKLTLPLVDSFDKTAAFNFSLDKGLAGLADHGFRIERCVLRYPARLRAVQRPNVLTTG